MGNIFCKDESFEAAIVSLAHPLVEATLHLYKDVLNAFLPTPGTCHYMFNLRDFAKVIQGIKLVPATHLRDPNKVTLHTCYILKKYIIVNDLIIIIISITILYS